MKDFQETALIASYLKNLNDKLADEQRVQIS